MVSPVYALVFVGVCAVFFLMMYRQMKRQIPYNTKLSNSESETTAKLADAITNVTTIRAFAGETTESKLFEKQTGKKTAAHWKLMNVQMKNETISRSGIAFVKILAFGGGMIGVVTLHTPIGALYLTLTYTLSLTERLWQFMFIIRNINRALGDAADMTEILQLEPAIKDPENPEPVRISHGAIEFDDVNFRYEEGSREPLVQRPGP